jgi:FMN phosphatase YigB (HAD superfamily)
MVYKVIAVDLDDVLISENDPFVVAFPSSTDCLKAMHKLLIPIVMVTHNTDPHRAIQKCGWQHYFNNVINDFDYTYKKTQLLQVCSTYQIQPCELVFFDDYPENIQSARELDATGVLVDRDTGITLNDIEILYR